MFRTIAKYSKDKLQGVIFTHYSLFQIKKNFLMDFILVFHKHNRRVDSEFMVLDKFSNMSHFLLRRNMSDIINIVNFFSQEAIGLHEIWSLVSNRDTKFLSHSGKILWKKLILL